MGDVWLQLGPCGKVSTGMPLHPGCSSRSPRLKLTQDLLPVQVLETVLVELQGGCAFEPWNSASFLADGFTGGPSPQYGHMARTVQSDWRNHAMSDCSEGRMLTLPSEQLGGCPTWRGFSNLIGAASFPGQAHIPLYVSC